VRGVMRYKCHCQQLKRSKWLADWCTWTLFYLPQPYVSMIMINYYSIVVIVSLCWDVSLVHLCTARLVARPILFSCISKKQTKPDPCCAHVQFVFHFRCMQSINIIQSLIIPLHRKFFMMSVQCLLWTCFCEN